jgi:hypothetical protein
MKLPESNIPTARNIFLNGEGTNRYHVTTDGGRYTVKIRIKGFLDFVHRLAY